MAGEWAMQGFFMLSAIEKSSGWWVGGVSPWRPEGRPGTEIAWAFLREMWGKGYAVEGAAAAANWAFLTLGWMEIVHVIDGNNVASQRVARKLGSTLRGPGRFPEPRYLEAVEIWGQSKEDWEKR